MMEAWSALRAPMPWALAPTRGWSLPVCKRPPMAMRGLWTGKPRWVYLPDPSVHNGTHYRVHTYPYFPFGHWKLKLGCGSNTCNEDVEYRYMSCGSLRGS